MTPGHAAALADNPGFSDLIDALAAAPMRAFRPVEPAVRAALAARAARVARLRRAGSVLAAAAAALAVAVLSDPGSDGRRTVLPQDPCGLAASASSALLSRQRPDGSWAADRGGESNVPAATALAMLELAGAKDDPAAAAAVSRGAAWLRAHQNADGSFGTAPADSVAGAWNLALGTTALLRLYGEGGRTDLFTPVDAAVTAVRDRLARPSPAAAERQLAAALALADSLEWPDERAGDLRRAMRRLGAGDGSFAAGRDALARLAGRI